MSGPTGQPLPPEPRRLTLEVGFGVIGFQYRCRVGGPGWDDNERNTLLQVFVLGLLDQADLRRGRLVRVPITDGWRFTNPPFRAELKVREPLQSGGQTFSTLHLDATLQHEPT